jgi:hypothetical protein
MADSGRHGSVLSEGGLALYAAGRVDTSLYDPRRFGNSEIEKALSALPKGVPELIFEAKALVIPENFPARVWDSEVHGVGYTPWLYCAGTSRQFQINIDGPAVVRAELCIDPTYMRPFPAIAPMTHDDAYWQPEGWPFVRFHIERLTSAHFEEPEDDQPKFRTEERLFPNGRTYRVSVPVKAPRRTASCRPDISPDVPVRVKIGAVCQ